MSLTLTIKMFSSLRWVMMYYGYELDPRGSRSEPGNIVVHDRPTPVLVPRIHRPRFEVQVE